MKSVLTLPIVSALFLLLGLGGCTVYAPMQPTISTITGRGQAELSGSIQPNGRLEAGGVYSPLPHLLVTAAGTFRPRLNDSTFFTTRQWETGLGTYWALGRRWQLTGLAGYGTAHGHRVYRPFDLLDDRPPRLHYQTRYRKLFGQVGLNRLAERHSFGLVFRLAKVDFAQLHYISEYGPYEVALPAPDMIRHELLFFYRQDLGQQQQWQLQFTTGLSADIHTPQTTDQPRNPYDDQRTRRPVPMASVGLVFRPRLGQSAPAE